MNGFLLVMLGGAAGSAARYGLGRVIAAWAGTGFPWGTLAVNLIGGLAMGVLAGLLPRWTGAEAARLLLSIGFLGGFTTFSSFALETVALIDRGAAPLAIVYTTLSVLGAVAGVYAGRALA
ncbi:fluoride efflux transporter CrcB [Sphingomonas sp.]|uniref:fluoride efflux transporter CrcB n=1 Tax=Sphingomonas sp. TaxID=28214 RepID=UPI001DD3C558|nr:fluoride efflux transporter CrcB [Sphingomonas sp.]MBX9797016.1 fluoride efflux transporter CrcB [Sphingomonas sp.]